jgi:hypothetical protein
MRVDDARSTRCDIARASKNASARRSGRAHGVAGGGIAAGVSPEQRRPKLPLMPVSVLIGRQSALRRA